MLGGVSCHTPPKTKVLRQSTVNERQLLLLPGAKLGTAILSRQPLLRWTQTPLDSNPDCVGKVGKTCSLTRHRAYLDRSSLNRFQFTSWTELQRGTWYSGVSGAIYPFHCCRLPTLTYEACLSCDIVLVLVRTSKNDTFSRVRQSHSHTTNTAVK